jgi:hypothetical protein
MIASLCPGVRAGASSAEVMELPFKCPFMAPAWLDRSYVKSESGFWPGRCNITSIVEGRPVPPSLLSTADEVIE